MAARLSAYSTGLVATGAWCPLCLLPSATEMECVVVIEQHGFELRLDGRRLWRCEDCGWGELMVTGPARQML